METSPHIKIYRLSELTGGIARILAEAFEERLFWVVADITDHSFYASKQHHYFTLVEKDANSNAVLARLGAVAWKPGAARIREFEAETGQQFRNGLQVLLRVSLDFHPVYGLKLVTHGIDAGFTLGKLEQQRRETLQRLLAECPDFIVKEGERYRTRNNSLPHRPVIQRLAVLTSAASAGYEDFHHTLATNTLGYRFVIDEYFVPVQGEAYAEVLCRKLEEICASGIDYDAVVIMRGGGAQTDFLIFDQYVLCRQIACMPIPVITGLGHHKNESIADLMAHTATKTPTMAAEFILAHNREFEEGLLDLRSRIVIRVQAGLAQRKRSLAAFSHTIAQEAREVLNGHRAGLVRMSGAVSGAARATLYRRNRELLHLSAPLAAAPRLQLARRQSELAQLSGRVASFSRLYLSRQQESLGHFEALCRLMDPDRLLDKGFALVYHEGRMVNNAAALPEGAAITVRLGGTDIHATITHKTPKDGQDTDV
ncbi:exodeoxyribonuclease VII large subunit [Paraflavisolibacter sp. H34]|uniref:exodeoxyribonuclease VII large subunit n=1 Tax=Huijunlia imazamoxiresistens TaxID=3127457 RepID=UPI00301A3CF6